MKPEEVKLLMDIYSVLKNGSQVFPKTNISLNVVTMCSVGTFKAHIQIEKEKFNI